MKKLHRLLYFGLGTFFMAAICLNGADLMTAQENEQTVRKVWKQAIVDNKRDYDKMIATLEKVIAADTASVAALTATLLKGWIEMDRVETEAQGSFDKARTLFETLSKKHSQTWQAQVCRILLVRMLHVDGKYREAIAAAKKGLVEIDWKLLTKARPPDFSELVEMSKTTSELTPDQLRYVIANSYLELKEPIEAGKWISQIEDQEMRRQIQQALGAR
jgi:tetratricopeptide (TPR) repeat protein